MTQDVELLLGEVASKDPPLAAAWYACGSVEGSIIALERYRVDARIGSDTGPGATVFTQQCDTLVGRIAPPELMESWARGGYHVQRGSLAELSAFVSMYRAAARISEMAPSEAAAEVFRAAPQFFRDSATQDDRSGLATAVENLVREGVTSAVAERKCAEAFRDVFGNPFVTHRMKMPAAPSKAAYHGMLADSSKAFQKALHVRNFEPAWLMANGHLVGDMVRGVVERGDYAAGDFQLLADALEDCGCTDGVITAHLRDQEDGRRCGKGCWVLDMLALFDTLLRD